MKGRNEPCAIGGVAWVIAQLKGVSIQEVADAAWKNTVELFGLDDIVDIPLVDAARVEEPKKEFDLKSEEWPSL